MFSLGLPRLCFAVGRGTVGAFLTYSILTLGIGAAHAESPLAFDIQVFLSSKAAARLTATHEGVSVLASFYGDPTDAGEDQVNELGTVDIASVRADLSGDSQTIHIGGKTLSGARLDWVKVPMVNVSIFSSRKASEDNILDCDFIDGPVEDVLKLSPVPLRCWLFEEQLTDKSYP